MENICYYGLVIIENQSLLCLLCLVNKWKINIWLALLYYVLFINQWNKSLLWQSHLSHVLISAHCDFWRIFCYYVYYVYYGYYVNSRHPIIRYIWNNVFKIMLVEPPQTRRRRTYERCNPSSNASAILRWEKLVISIQ